MIWLGIGIGSPLIVGGLIAWTSQLTVDHRVRIGVVSLGLHPYVPNIPFSWIWVFLFVFGVAASGQP